jgi:hypothetical protein
MPNTPYANGQSPAAKHQDGLANSPLVLPETGHIGDMQVPDMMLNAAAKEVGQGGK